MWLHAPSRGHHRRYKNPTLTPTKPSNAIRASVSLTQMKTIAKIITAGHNRIDPNPPTLPTLQSHLQHLPPSAAWAATRLKRSDDGETIAAALQTGTAVAVSDGSLKLDFGTAAFVIESHNSINRITGINQVPGPISAGDSHRCELAGLFGIAMTLKCICDLHKITSGSLTIACDNTAALKVFDPEFVPLPNAKNFDLLCAVYDAIQKSPLAWHPVHVKGHQDDNPMLRPLTRLEKLNVEMDHLAKAHWNHLLHHSNPCPTPTHLQILGEGWQLWSGDQKIAQPSRSALYNHLQDPITQQWWIRHKIIPNVAQHTMLTGPPLEVYSINFHVLAVTGLPSSAVNNAECTKPFLNGANNQIHHVLVVALTLKTPTMCINALTISLLPTPWMASTLSKQTPRDWHMPTYHSCYHPLSFTVETILTYRSCSH